MVDDLQKDERTLLAVVRALEVIWNRLGSDLKLSMVDPEPEKQPAENCGNDLLVCKTGEDRAGFPTPKAGERWRRRSYS